MLFIRCNVATIRIHTGIRTDYTDRLHTIHQHHHQHRRHRHRQGMVIFVIDFLWQNIVRAIPDVKHTKAHTNTKPFTHIRSTEIPPPPSQTRPLPQPLTHLCINQGVCGMFVCMYGLVYLDIRWLKIIGLWGIPQRKCSLEFELWNTK